MPSRLQPPTTLLGANPIPHRGQIQGRGYDRRQEAEQKQVEIMDKEVNQAARDSDDTLVCFIKNTVEDHIMDSGALFHATYCKEELKGVVDVVLKSYFGTSWTLKDVRYIPSLKRRLISAGQLDEEGYHVGFKDQQWKVTKGSLVVAYGNKRRSLYMVEIGISMLDSKDNVPDVRKVDIYFCKPGGLGKQKDLSFIMSVKTRKLQRLEQVHTQGCGPTFIASI
ncbi:hypothetical protein Tco_0725083 [Tanacetum coccineum]|uniref:Retrovirus-related Pol polyprotein from transposon TNT 1-94-like beta-barrel domain-containing protein n=1 Tax=Tanacetum coccineum TaxID=301880 RepID=A0ABQ4YE05_9ASTR